MSQAMTWPVPLMPINLGDDNAVRKARIPQIRPLDVLYGLFYKSKTPCAARFPTISESTVPLHLLHSICLLVLLR